MHDALDLRPWARLHSVPQRHDAASRIGRGYGCPHRPPYHLLVQEGAASWLDFAPFSWLSFQGNAASLLDFAVGTGSGTIFMGGQNIFFACGAHPLSIPYCSARYCELYRTVILCVFSMHSAYRLSTHSKSTRCYKLFIKLGIHPLENLPGYSQACNHAILLGQNPALSLQSSRQG